MMTVEFSENGAFRASFSNNPSLISEGTYQVKGENLIAVTTQTPQGDDQTVEMEYTIDGRRLTLIYGGETQVFYRVDD
jgi:hypothetical protein